ncbi:dienelactone hydrolase family protein [Silvanigrella aquatica]|uniref:Dienelactone hydrolase domain-containing protein n=1 Tax=Silvanigrella aquatica TaxID=1915309 RepID=A0A1L4CYJ5_9BACT|nr:dienelactone hydrolase family protein [Silvanigrella aquatica]APJ03024.1 hypothetical protein AXG55_03475 [Silvanigrella aquatica]
MSTPSWRLRMKTMDIEYRVDDTLCRGYLVEPNAQGAKLPGIIFYTDFWGVTERQKKTAEKLANMGAVVLVADMYGNQQCGKTFEDSGRLMNSVIKDNAVYKNRIVTPFELLKKNLHVNQNKLFSIGYCFGGASSLMLARIGEGLTGAISLHGLLTSHIRVSANKKMPKLLVLHGAQDPLVSDQDIKSFNEEMQGCHADYTFISFGNCKHAFSNAEAEENNMTSYSYSADKRSDVYIRQFLTENF